MRVRGIVKKVALILAGIAALTAVGFGVKAIVDFTNEDLKTISPAFEVGNLGADGKWVDDKTTLYTKEAFGCYGLQVKPDFDSEVNYQIFYYDILDNYISSTAVLSDGFSGEAPVNGAYARMVIVPQNDEDGKISWTETLSYPKQLTVKVKKEQDINERFGVFKGKMMQVVSDTDNLVFTKGLWFSPETMAWENWDVYSVTSSTVLKVQGGSTLKTTFEGLGKEIAGFKVYQFSDLPLDDNMIAGGFGETAYDSVGLDRKTKYVFISIRVAEGQTWTDAELSKLPSCFNITK